MKRSVMFVVLALVVWLSTGLTTGLLVSPRVEQVTRTGPTVLLTTTATITATHALTSTATITKSITLTSTETVTETTSITPETPQLYNQSGVAVCFSRPMNCQTMLEVLINSAQKRVLVAVYAFTNDRLANALIAAHRRGVEVRVLLEAEAAEIRGSEYGRLKEAGVDVRLDGNPALMHHKFMVIDDAIVVTGSYNWSIAAEEDNDENVVAILSEDVAKLFVEEFDRMWAVSTG